MNVQIENIYNLIKQGNVEEASKAIYKYFTSDKSDLSEWLKSYLQSNPPEVFTANGFDCEMANDKLVKLNEYTFFPHNADGKLLHIAVELVLHDLLSVTYWLEPNQ